MTLVDQAYCVVCRNMPRAHDGGAMGHSFTPPGVDPADRLLTGVYARHGAPRPTEMDEEPPNLAEQRAAQLRAALLTSSALDALPDPVPLVGDLLMRDSLAWLHGKPASGKSFLALDWAGSVATGRTWHGRPVSQGPVLYLVAEGAAGLRRRVRAWEHRHGVRMDGVVFLPVAVQLMSPTEVDALCLVAADVRPALAVVDTQARVTVGAEENSAKDMGQLVAAVDRLREASGGACVLTVHHEARAGDALRGSTSLEGAANTIIRATRERGKTLVRLDCVKQKDEEEAEPIMLRLTSHGNSAVLEEVAGSGADPVADLVALLDDLGVPADAGRDRVRNILASHGQKIGNALLAEALRVRKSGRENLSGDARTGTNLGTNSTPVHTPVPGTAETPGQTCPGQVGDRPDSHPHPESPDLSAPSPPLKGGQVGDSGSIAPNPNGHASLPWGEWTA